MKVIDLLNKIAFQDEPMPDFIKYLGDTFEFKCSDNLTGCWNYYCNENKEYLFIEGRMREYWFLNEEIEIIEEPKKIEFIPILEEDEPFLNVLEINQTRRKLNEIIDYINKGV